MMTIGDVINEYGQQHTPYMNQLVNHLPMGQLALYRMTGDIETVKKYSMDFCRRFHFDQVKPPEGTVSSLEACLGKREMYADCLMLIRQMVEKEGLESVVKEVLNTYIHGMSSGLFHVLIRMAYAMEGVALEKQLKEEAVRALAYYITAYREAKLLYRRILPDQVVAEMKSLEQDNKIRQILSDHDSMGRKIRGLYASEYYLDKGFVVHGDESDKVKGLLMLLVPAFKNSNHILVLHGITGLHALLVLKPYCNDFSLALDIYTTSCLTHLLTTDNLIYHGTDPVRQEQAWASLRRQGSQSKDVHTIKFTYTCSQLEEQFGYVTAGLKDAAAFRIDSN